MINKNGEKKKVKDGIIYNPKLGRIVEHQGYSTKVYWSMQKLDDLRRLYPTTLNDDLVEILGFSKRTIIRKARELGLEKDKQWLFGVWERNRKMAQMESRRKGYPNGRKKSEHFNLEHEYKVGHKLTPEQKQRQSESIRKWNKTHLYERHKRALKAWETRRAKARINNL